MQVLPEESPVKACIGLFTTTSIQTKLCTILSATFDLPVAPSRYHSSHACRTCRDQAKSVYNKLEELRSMARKSYEASSHSTVVAHQGHKRTKDTSSGPDVSPETLKAQPPRKMRPGKRLIFSCKTMYVKMTLKYIK